jgi:Calcineurin-like phosphoesterase
MHPDIVALPGNTRGDDIIIGDLHGSLFLLQAQLQALKPEDRLFMVGDLIDRGENSLGVLELIKSINQKRKAANLAPQIYITRGNHEDMFLNYLDNRLNISMVEPMEAEAIAENYMMNGGEWTESVDDKTLKEQKKFLESLPYIIHVKGKKPFNIVHADMPFDDKTLRDLIAKKQLSLTEDQKHYATWARKESMLIPIVPTGRNKKSLPTYCGHSIRGGVRGNTNHINLDIGSFESEALCAVNHTQKKCFPVTKNNSIDPALQVFIEKINKHLAPSKRARK